VSDVDENLNRWLLARIPLTERNGGYMLEKQSDNNGSAKAAGN
jgi:hypothetical protein